MKKATINTDPNAGNSPNTYWRGGYGLSRCLSVQIGPREFLRDAKGRVRRFSSWGAAVKAAKAAGYIIEE